MTLHRTEGRLDYFVGLDLGQTQEYTAIAVVEKTTPPINPQTGQRPDPTYAVRHLERFTLGTPYPEIFKRVLEMYKDPMLKKSPLVVDQTGVGKAVIQMLRQTKGAPHLIPVTIVTGLAATLDGHGGWLVPKKDLVGSVQVLLQTRRITIAESLPDAAMLVNELINFKIKPKATVSTDPIADWREGVQDDLVFAVGIAVWHAERQCVCDWRLEMPVVITPRRPPWWTGWR